MNAVRRKKLMWVMFTLAGAAIAVVLVIYAIGQQTDYYFDATAIAQGEAQQDKRIRAVEWWLLAVFSEHQTIL